MVQGRSGNAGKCRAHPQSESGALGPDGRFGGLRGPHHENWAGMVCPPLTIMGGKANLPDFRYIFRPKMHILSTRLLGVPFGPQGAMPDPAPHRGVPGTKVFNKITKKCTGDKPRPLPGAEPARWAELQQIFQPPWELPWTGDWVQVRPWGQKLASFQTNFGVQVHGWCHRPKRHFIFGPQA